VDDLEEIGDLEGYIERTTYCSQGYFTSKNYMRELVATVIKRKPIITLSDPDISRGGLSVDQVRTQLIEADLLAVERWNFRPSDPSELSTAKSDGTLFWPGGETLSEQLFAIDPIEWNREPHFP
jgi:hypothetical protein